MSDLVVRVLRVRGRADADIPLPGLATAGSAGADLCACVEKDQVLAPGERTLVPTGFALAIPEGHEGQIRARSGLALRHGLFLPNAPGTIDADYRGEVKVIVQNGGQEPFVIRRGERIAQLVIAPVARPTFALVEEAEELGETDRAGGGFGHTGR